MHTYGAFTDTALHVLTINTDGSKNVNRYDISRMPAHIGELYGVATHCQVDHVWVMPTSTLTTLNTRPFIDNADSTIWDILPSYTAYKDKYHKDPADDALVKYAGLWRRNTSGPEGRRVQVCFPPYTEWAKEPGWVIETPHDLLGTLYYLHTALDTPVEWNTGHTGLTLFRSLHFKHPDWIRASELLDEDKKRRQEDQALVYPFNRCAGDIYWRCECLPETAIGWFIHVVDRNNAYLAGARSGAVGAGDPVHRVGSVIKDETLPGAYLVTYETGDSVFDGRQLPLIVSKTRWVTADILRYTREIGYSVQVEECYQFDEKHRTFDSLALALWNARDSLHPERGDSKKYPNLRCRQNAYLSMKAIAHVVIGKFANAWTSLYRPDWESTVVGRARETQFRKMHALNKLGIRPVFVNSDSMYFLSQDPNPQTAIPSIFDRADQLGGYKYVYTVQVTREVLEVWEDKKVGLADYLKNKMPHLEVEMH